MQIVSRAQWGARPAKSRVFGDRVTETYLHHSVGYGPGGESYMRIMQNQHIDINGWADIAYNFVIDPGDLRVFEGRGWGVRPGSQKSHNRGTWSVCVMGDYRVTKPTQGLLATIVALIRHGAIQGHIPLILTGGHRDAPGQSTTCPGGYLHSRIPDIRTFLTTPLEEDVMTPDQEAKLDRLLALAQPAATWGGTTIKDPVTNQDWHPSTFLISFRKSLTQLTAAVGALDSEGISEAELDVRITQLLNLLPDRVLARLRDRLS